MGNWQQLLGARLSGNSTSLEVLVAKMMAATAMAFITSLALQARQPAAAADSSPHKVQFVTIEKDVKLEVLDWGGSGRPLVFLAGSGLDAHEFDSFAPKFTGAHHVYGISRRAHPHLQTATTRPIILGMTFWQ